jgi:hypothetical protein
MENLGKVQVPKNFAENLCQRIQDAIRNNKHILPAQFQDKDLNFNFAITVDAKIHVEVAGVSCDFEIHYPELPQK